MKLLLNLLCYFIYLKTELLVYSQCSWPSSINSCLALVTDTLTKNFVRNEIGKNDGTNVLRSRIESTRGKKCYIDY